MISLLLPSRGRPSNIDRLVRSLDATTEGEWELIVRLDDDDPELRVYLHELDLGNQVTFVIGPRILLSTLWNECAERAKGEILMHAGDDIVFLTPGWDAIVRDAFPEDGIAFVHGDDLSPNGSWLGTHGFVTREWVDAVGYFVPPLFSSDWNDAWLNEVANMLERRIFVPIVTEHLHPAFDKAEWDLTHRERIERHHADDTYRTWRDTQHLRYRDAKALEAVMAR